MMNRVLHVHNAKTGKVLHTLTHIHYHAWEDFSVPSSKAMDDLMSALSMQADLLFTQIEKLEKGYSKQPERILMHCLAGRGRTGTAMAIVNAHMTLQWQIMHIDQSQMTEA